MVMWFFIIMLLIIKLMPRNFMVAYIGCILHLVYK
jgi:hypothetical protein